MKKPPCVSVSKTTGVHVCASEQLFYNLHFMSKLIEYASKGPLFDRKGVYFVSTLIENGYISRQKISKRG